MKIGTTFRQGDVALVRVNALPDGCAEVPHDGGAIVLAYGESTGHKHAVYDHVVERPGAADEITEAAISRAQSKARLLRAPSGERYLEVREAVTLRHDEHTPHVIPPGTYLLPVQCEYSPKELQRVAD